MSLASSSPVRAGSVLGPLPFALAHLACLAAVVTGVDAAAVALCAALYAARMFGVTAGYHRYFAHRSYRMGRAMQLAMAWLAMTSAQKGVLWWAAHHRNHHRFSDQPGDPHSPRRDGFWWSHVGWILSPRYGRSEIERVRDLARFPELRWLDRHYLVPPASLALACLVALGWSGLVVGFFWSTVLLWHGTFVINSLAHVIGTRRYPTGDDSRNHGVLALITFGEGWHNNHHHYPSSARQGFFWWEIDLSWYALRALARVGLVHDLREVPDEVLREGRESAGRAAA